MTNSAKTKSQVLDIILARALTSLKECVTILHTHLSPAGGRYGQSAVGNGGR